MSFSHLKPLNIIRFYCLSSKVKSVTPNKRYLVPSKPIKSKIDPNKLPPRTKIDADTIALLERLSLVDCANKQGIETLEEAIAFADQIQQVNTEQVEPLITVLEDRPLRVREDSVTEGNSREEVLRNAQITEEDYFVAPPGNIPLEARDNLLYEEQNDNVREDSVLLQENLRTEWFNNIVINKDISVFPSLNGISETYNFAKEICLETFPFAVTQFTETKSLLQNLTTKQSDKNIDFLDFFENGTIFECSIFAAPSNAIQLFHHWQRQRRMWWRKFSPSPGRYSLTDIKNDNGNAQSVKIMAKYPWNKEQLIETISLSNDHSEISSEQLQFKEGKRTIKAQCIVSKICLSTMVLNTLCDAYDEPLFQGNPRPLLRLHRKLAPYKISFSIPSGPKSVVDELKDLALYLCRQLRTNHVSSLYIPSSYKNTLETQWKQYDQMGVPYNLLLNENTLKTGIAQLRSRDTTLKEQVHVTNLPVYVEQLFKNY